MLKCLDKLLNLTHANLSCHDIDKKFGDEPPAEEESVGPVRKDGGKSGEGKQKLPVY